MKKVVVLLPTYNEKNNVERFTKEVLDQERLVPGYQVEVLISDSHSPDGTGELAKKLAKKNPKVHFIETERGLGVGLIKGHQYSLEKLHPDVLAQLDADGQVEVDVLQRLVKAIDEGYDLAIGSRFVKGGENRLSPSRKLFTYGSSLICRILMGPFNIQEFTNSARAFTPSLFKKINLDRVPWREQSFISQPAFLHEAVLAGAKYQEVPLVFKNRAEGYSKNKIANYIYDVITYCIDARLYSWGIRIPFYQFTHRAKTFVKFSVVGLTGTAVDFLFYNFFIKKFGLPPATAKVFSTEIAIVNNFTLNNFWTFRARKTKTNIWQKFGLFNMVSLGGLAIAVLIIKFLHIIYGDGYADIFGWNLAYYNIYFFVTIIPVLSWNFTVNHFVTWKHQKELS